MALVGAAPSCGDDSDSNGSTAPTNTPCSNLAADLCAQSCACADDCGIIFPAGASQGFGNEIESAVSQCNRAFGNSCVDPGVDVTACATALESATCSATPVEPGLELPADCVP